MYSVAMTAIVCGMESRPVRVETDVSNGLPGLELVGLLSSEVKEARERVRVSLKNSGFSLPVQRITVNLAPADLRKEGSGMDLAISLGILASCAELPQACLSRVLLLGELGLDGSLRPVRGILPTVRGALGQEPGENIGLCIVPAENAAEAAAAVGSKRNVRVVGAGSLSEVMTYLKLPEAERDAFLVPAVFEASPPKCAQDRAGVDFAEVSGQEEAKRAAEIAAAGFHNLFLTGQPGSGKTMIAKRLPTVLPKLSLEESLEVAAIYSVAGRPFSESGPAADRPFQSPHHTVSRQALIGGGMRARPGMVSLAHRGVLFLDELPEFSRETLEALRQPLEDRQVCVARVQGIYTYPADFMLVAAANPCPCGYYPDVNRCSCTKREVERYRNRISGPVLDRFDLCVEVRRPDLKALGAEDKPESSAQIRKRVLMARRMQEKRCRNTPFHSNADLTDEYVRRWCALDGAGQRLMIQAFESMQLSARGYYRILKTARTIADLAGEKQILSAHLSEALLLRMRPGK